MDEAGFYATCAQVIPVLMLALVFEQKFFAPREDESAGESLFLLATLVALTAGEVIAILVLIEDEPPTLFHESMVINAIVFGMLGVFVPLYRPRFAALSRTLPNAVVSVLRWAWLPALIAFFALMYIFASSAVLGATALALFIALLVASGLTMWRK